MTSPLEKPKEDYAATIKVIGTQTGVGIDAQLTHAIIIDYLQQLTKRVEHLEQLLEGLRNK